MFRLNILHQMCQCADSEVVISVAVFMIVLSCILTLLSIPFVGYSGTGIFRCSTLWPMQLVGLLRQYLGWIPVDIDTQKKVYWCILLLDTLQGTDRIVLPCNLKSFV